MRFQVACVHGMRGETDQAFAWLDKTLAQRDSGLTRLTTTRLARLAARCFHSDIALVPVPHRRLRGLGQDWNWVVLKPDDDASTGVSLRVGALEIGSVDARN